MTAVKEVAIGIIKRLPDESTLEDIQYHLYVRQKVERGIQAIEDGRVVSQADVGGFVRGSRGWTDPTGDGEYASPLVGEAAPRERGGEGGLVSRVA